MHCSFLAALALSACSAERPAEEPRVSSVEETNILNIGWGGIAVAEPDEGKRHWSTWTINLVDGSAAYGWSSDTAFPQTLRFELAGPGTIKAFVVDTRFESVAREDGSASQSPDGSPVRRFEIFGSTAGPDGDFTKLFEAEAKENARSVFALDAPASARWLKLVIHSNWANAGATRLSEFEALGDLDERGAASIADVSGVYAHEYGPIILRQQGNAIDGCYSNGLGTLRGTIFGRIMRLAWFSAAEGSIGAATLVPADGRLYGFWRRPGDEMGSPWNATRTGDLTSADLNGCEAIRAGGAL